MKYGWSSFFVLVARSFRQLVVAKAINDFLSSINLIISMETSYIASHKIFQFSLSALHFYSPVIFEPDELWVDSKQTPSTMKV